MDIEARFNDIDRRLDSLLGAMGVCSPRTRQGRTPVADAYEQIASRVAAIKVAAQATRDKAANAAQTEIAAAQQAITRRQAALSAAERIEKELYGAVFFLNRQLEGSGLAVDTQRQIWEGGSLVMTIEVRLSVEGNDVPHRLAFDIAGDQTVTIRPPLHQGSSLIQTPVSEWGMGQMMDLLLTFVERYGPKPA